MSKSMTPIFDTTVSKLPPRSPKEMVQYKRAIKELTQLVIENKKEVEKSLTREVENVRK